jgi:hypothetical protein
MAVTKIGGFFVMAQRYILQVVTLPVHPKFNQLLSGLNYIVYMLLILTGISNEDLGIYSH